MIILEKIVILPRYLDNRFLMIDRTDTTALITGKPRLHRDAGTIYTNFTR